MKRFLKRILSQADLETISAKIAAVEKTTTGQIRICIRQRRHWRERKLTLHEVAVHEFHRLGMEHTKQRTGVLLLLLMSERKFQIVADKGIHEKVKEGTWDEVAGLMAKDFVAGNFCAGITGGINHIGEILTKHFPANGDKAQLPNDVVVD